MATGVATATLVATPIIRAKMASTASAENMTNVFSVMVITSAAATTTSSEILQPPPAPIHVARHTALRRSLPFRLSRANVRSATASAYLARNTAKRFLIGALVGDQTVRKLLDLNSSTL